MERRDRVEQDVTDSDADGDYSARLGTDRAETGVAVWDSFYDPDRPWPFLHDTEIYATTFTLPLLSGEGEGQADCYGADLDCDHVLSLSGATSGHPVLQRPACTAQPPHKRPKTAMFPAPGTTLAARPTPPTTTPKIKYQPF